MAPHVLPHLGEFSLQDQGTRLAYVVLASSASEKVLVVLQAILLTQIAPWVAVVLRNFSNVPAEALLAVTSDAL